MSVHYFLHRKPLEYYEYQIVRSAPSFLNVLLNRHQKVVYKTSSREEAVKKIKDLQHYGQNSIINELSHEYSQFEIIHKVKE